MTFLYWLCIVWVLLPLGLTTLAHGVNTYKGSLLAVVFFGVIQQGWFDMSIVWPVLTGLLGISVGVVSIPTKTASPVSAE
jgi:hypothetical protein